MRYKARQVGVPKELYRTLKVWCSSNEMSMTNFYREMIDWFFAKVIKTSQNSTYCASHKKGYPMSLWLDEKYINKIHRVAERNRVSEARVLFTILIAYLKEKNIYDYLSSH